MEETIVLMVEFEHQQVTAQDIPDKIPVVPENITWEDIELMLKVYSNQQSISVYYIDEEGDEIIIESQEELNEAFKVARKNNNIVKVLIRFLTPPDFIYGSPSSMSPWTTKEARRIEDPDYSLKAYDGAFYLCCEYTDLVLDVCGQRDAPNTQLILWPRKTFGQEYVANQLWYFDGQRLRSLMSGFSIDVNGDQMVVNPRQQDKLTQFWSLDVVKALRNPYSPYLVVGCDSVQAGREVKVGYSGSGLVQRVWRLKAEPRIDLMKYHSVTQDMHEVLESPMPVLPNIGGCYPFPYPHPELPTNSGVVHHKGVICDVCDKGIFGIRYKCGFCNDFDLCESCEATPGVHDNSHVLLKIRQPLHCPADPQNLATQPPYPNPSQGYNPLIIGPALQRSRGLITASAGVAEFCENFAQTSRITSEKQADAVYEDDETIPDGMHVDPGVTLLKKWRVRNVGDMAWASKTVLRQMSGEMQSTRSEVSVPYIEPRKSGVVGVELITPQEPGYYESHWKLFSHGREFGPDLWCRVTVEEEIKYEPDGVSQKEEEKTAAGEADNEPNSANHTPASISFPSTPANTPLAMTPPFTPTVTKITPLLAAANEMNNLDIEANHVEKNEVTSDSSGAAAATENNDLTAVVSIVEEMCHLSMDDLADDEGSVGSASDAESDDFFIVPIPDCFNVTLPARKEASTTVVVKKSRSSCASSSVGDEGNYPADNSSSVRLLPPPTRFMNDGQDPDSDLGSFTEVLSDTESSTSSLDSLCDIPQYRTLHDFFEEEERYKRKAGHNREAQQLLEDVTDLSATNNLNKNSAEEVNSNAGVLGQHGEVVSYSSNIDDVEHGSAAEELGNLEYHDAATHHSSEEINGQGESGRPEGQGEPLKGEGDIEEAEEATELSAAGEAAATAPQQKPKDVEDMAYEVMSTVIGVAGKAMSAAFCTAKDVYHTLQARNSYSPPRSTWTPRENTWTPPASTWTPVQPTWSPPEQQWVQPESTSPGLDQLIGGADEPYIPPTSQEPASTRRPQCMDNMSNMQKLIEMGFGNRELNARVLEAYNDDLEAAVQQLLHENDDWYSTRH